LDELLNEIQTFSILSRIAAPLITFLFFLYPEPQVTAPLVHELSSCLSIFSRLSNSIAIQNSEARYNMLNKQFSFQRNLKVVGTTHPYRGGGLQNKEVTVPGILFFTKQRAFLSFFLCFFLCFFVSFFLSFFSFSLHISLFLFFS